CARSHVVNGLLLDYW
nr:immunoglobulin heavy chain junction region [Macaca mulatta]MOV48239.1 immunoglobulin heavy chain junction region [Macaca mulatta]MOV51746.1 immunoglobulin heavy chain junction region [Macaca mulatta]